MLYLFHKEMEDKMPHIGDIQKRKWKYKSIWLPCKSCGQERWTNYKTPHNYCHSCGNRIKNSSEPDEIPTNPIIGEIRRWGELGKRKSYKWIACEGCGATKWVEIISLKEGKLNSCHCIKCSSKIGAMKASTTKFSKYGRFKDRDGYIHIRILSGSPYFDMGHGLTGRDLRYVPEHRLVLAQFLGRSLQSWELVHHKNGIRDDNRLENLEVTIRGKHLTSYPGGYKEGYDAGYKAGSNTKIQELLKQIKLLRWESRQYGRKEIS